MVLPAEKEGFGDCSNLSQCAAVCPEETAELNRDLLKAQTQGD